MNNSTYIPNLPTELQALLEEVSKLYRSFEDIVNHLISHFDKVRLSYLTFHANTIVSIKNANDHNIDLQELSTLEKTIKKYTNLLKKWLQNVGSEYYEFTTSLTNTLQYVSQYMNLVDSGTDGPTNTLTEMVQKTRRANIISNMYKKVTTAIDKLNLIVGHFNTFNQNLATSLVLYPGIKLVPVSIKALLVEVEKYKRPNDQQDIASYRVILDYVKYLLGRDDDDVAKLHVKGFLVNYKYFNLDDFRNFTADTGATNVSGGGDNKENINNGDKIPPPEKTTTSPEGSDSTSNKRKHSNSEDTPIRKPIDPMLYEYIMRNYTKPDKREKNEEEFKLKQKQYKRMLGNDDSDSDDQNLLIEK